MKAGRKESAKRGCNGTPDAIGSGSCREAGRRKEMSDCQSEGCLDMARHQENNLLNKDLEIADLRSENARLKRRLEVVEALEKEHEAVKPIIPYLMECAKHHRDDWQLEGYSKELPTRGPMPILIEDHHAVEKILEGRK